MARLALKVLQVQRKIKIAVVIVVIAAASVGLYSQLAKIQIVDGQLFWTFTTTEPKIGEAIMFREVKFVYVAYIPPPKGVLDLPSTYLYKVTFKDGTEENLTLTYGGLTGIGYTAKALTAHERPKAGVIWTVNERSWKYVVSFW